MDDNGRRRHSRHAAAAAHCSTGPVAFLNPTTHYHRVAAPAPSAQPQGGGDAGPGPPQVYHVWRSRDNRKGRHSAVVPQGSKPLTASNFPRATNTLAETLHGVLKMATRFPVWDVSYDVAVVFTLGSVVWCINGFMVWLPLVAPWTEFPDEVSLGGGVTAFIGATIFEFGSVLMMLEAVNENREDCFGWALEEALEDHGPRLRTTYEKECRHHHQNKRSLLRSSAVTTATAVAAVGNVVKGKDSPSSNKPTGQRRWSWWPTWHELTTHYLREVGFLACLAQMVGATVFWIAGFTGLPPVFDALDVPVANGVYWLPQVVGGSGFIVSSALLMLEVQDKWYKPAPKILGWHIGLWNLVGAVGFTLCGALGFAVESGPPAVEYASTLATFVGSWAFLIGSVVQWFESLDKYTISVGRVPVSLLAGDEKA